MTLLPPDREFIQMLIQGVKAEIKFTNDILGKDITIIKEQTLKTNGRVTHLEENTKEFEKYVNQVIDTRDIHYTNKDEYEKLKQEVDSLKIENISKKEIKKWMITSIGVFSTILIIIVNFEKIINLFI